MVRWIAVVAMLGSGCGPALVEVDDATSISDVSDSGPRPTSTAQEGGPGGGPGDAVTSLTTVDPSTTDTASPTSSESSEPSSGGMDPVMLDDCPDPPQLERTELDIGVGAVKLGVVPFDADGIGTLDLAISLDEGRVEVLTGLGDGGFEISSTLQLEMGAQPYDIVAGDLNEDGANDLIAADSNGERVFTWLANGAGGYLDPVAMDVVLQPWTMALHDLDSDQHLDLAVLIDRDHGYVLAAYGDGMGGLAPGPEFAVQSGPSEFAMADLDLDGRIDAIGTDVGSGVLVRQNVGDGYFDDAGKLDLPIGNGGVLAADLDGDGFPEIVVSSAIESDTPLYVWSGAPDFGHGEPDVLLTPQPLVSIVATDAGGGPTRDVAAIGDVFGIDRLWLMIDWGTPQACQHMFTLDEGDAHRLAAADLDGDGDDDYVITQTTGVSIVTRF